jgi:hypothetical protein
MFMRQPSAWRQTPSGFQVARHGQGHGVFWVSVGFGPSFGRLCITGFWASDVVVVADKRTRQIGDIRLII